MRKRVLFLFFTIILTACGFNSDADRRGGASSEPTPIPTAVAAARPTFTVMEGEVVYALSFSGRVAPVVEQALSFSQSGVVGEVYVRPGELVTAGTLLAVLDTTGWEADLVLAQSALAIATEQLDSREQAILRARQEAELRRDLAQLDLDFAVATADPEPTAAQQYEIDRLTILLALAQLELDSLNDDVDPELAAAVDEAALKVAELERQIEQADLLAPFDGRVSTFSVSAGRVVNAGEAVGIIADPDQIEVSAGLNESELEELAEGFTAVISPTGGPGDDLAGSIRRLPYPYGGGSETSGADSDPSVRIQFDDMGEAQATYEPGDRVRVTVVVTVRTDTLWLPPAAIRDFNGRKFVVVEENGVQQRVDVSLGITGEGRVEIVDGLRAGQIIIGQ